MLLYEYRVRDAIDNLRRYACNLRTKFDNNAEVDNLTLDTANLEQLYNNLLGILPKEIQTCSNLERHLYFMKYYLKRNDIKSNRGDINDICEHDIAEIEKAFLLWCKQPKHYDDELAKGVSDLLAKQEIDSAVRKAFAILKTRLTRQFTMPDSIDGPELVNRIFGSNGCHGLPIDDGKRQALRDLLAGLYGVFRNKYAHNDITPTWAEAEAIISMVNVTLLELDRLATKPVA